LISVLLAFFLLVLIEFEKLAFVLPPEDHRIRGLTK